MRLAVISSCLLMVLPLWPSLFGAEAAIRTEFQGVPGFIEAGTDLGMEIHYDIPAALGEVQLHAEMKTPVSAVVYGAQVFPVRGRGVVRTAIPVPPGTASAEIYIVAWYGEDWQDPLVPFEYSPLITVLTREEVLRMEAQRQAAEVWHGEQRLPEGPLTGLFWAPDLPGYDIETAARFQETLEARGLTVVRLGLEPITNPYILKSEIFRTVALWHSCVYPYDGGAAIQQYLRSGGHLVALETPAFQTPVARHEGEWLTADAVRERLGQLRPGSLLWDLDSITADRVSTSESVGSRTLWDIVEVDGRTALHVRIPEFSNFNTVALPQLETPAATDPRALTCFRARGGPDTTRLALEWREDDGSRWFATVPLTTEWRHFALRADEFVYWHDSSSEGRGSRGDTLNLSAARLFTAGLALSHMSLPAGEHEFWIADIGMVTSDSDLPLVPETMVVKPVDTITPAYKFHDVTGAARVRSRPGQSLLPGLDLPAPQGLKSVHPRPRGVGYAKDRGWRWIPLVEAWTEDGAFRGTPVSAMLLESGDLSGAFAVSVALPADTLAESAVQEAVADLMVRLESRPLFLEAGARYFAHYPGESIPLGAHFWGGGAALAPGSRVRFTGFAAGDPVYEQELETLDGSGVECVWEDAPTAGNTDLVVTAELLGPDGEVLDRLSHDIVVWHPSPDPEYLQVRDGRLYAGDERWIAHGVNYMPSSGIGYDAADGYFEYWLDPQPYDPEVIDRDLRRVRDIGFNMVSIFCYHRSLASRNLLDILERCRRYGLRVNMSLRPGTPLDFRWQEMRELIEAYRLAEHDIIFAYDLAWEPVFGNDERRRVWDGAWREWVAEQYADLATAEQDWGVPVPRTADGTVTGPSDAQLREDGEHRIMASAYRRFLDDLLARKYGEARRLVRTLDPHHLVSFRMNVAGDPDVDGSWVAFDFKGLGTAVDLLEPEGYGRIGDWDKVRRGRFTADYGRCMAPGLPIVWAEFGISPWSAEAQVLSDEQHRRHAEFYHDYYTMASRSGVDGTVCWWYPGGYRVNERTDFGIINPDGTWRENTRVIHEWSERLGTEWDTSAVDVWLTVDRDATSEGLRGIYKAVGDRYWDLLDNGLVPGLRTDGAGLTSATAPPVAVGNRPFQAGVNPHKFLNAVVESVAVLGDGSWEHLSEDESIAVSGRERLSLQVVLANCGEAAWLAGAGEGAVVLDCGGQLRELPVDVPRGGRVAVVFELGTDELARRGSLACRLRALPDVPFGQVRVLSVE